jgi:DNA-binding NtrC family response regulator
MPRILIVDDKASLRKMLKEALEAQGHEVRAVSSGGEALLALKRQGAALMLTDLRMPGLDGLALTREVRKAAPETAVIVMTAYGTVDTAVDAMRLGAVNFLTKPFSLDHLKVVVDKALAVSALEGENRGLRAQLSGDYRFDGVMGSGKAVKKLHQLIGKAAPTDSVVLLTGESGTGKELVARAIHVNSRRAAKPFLKVNCAALAPGIIESELFGHERGSFTGAHQRRLGRFELADGGTLLLDEVGDLPAEVQVKLLRVLQEKELERVGGAQPIQVDVRLVAATNRDLAQLVSQGRFREDLYFRLNVIPIHLPPLRERRDDIDTLARHLLARLRPEIRPGTAPRLAPDALKLLQRYSFPGNIRELENLLQRALVLCGPDGLIRAEHLPGELGQAQAKTKAPRGGDFNRQVEGLERHLIVEAMREHQGSQSAAAKALGLSRTLLIYKLKKFKLDPVSYKKAKPKAKAKTRQGRP